MTVVVCNPKPNKNENHREKIEIEPKPKKGSYEKSFFRGKKNR